MEVGRIKGTLRANDPTGEILRLELIGGEGGVERGIVYESYGEKAEGFEMLKVNSAGLDNPSYSLKIS